MLRDGCGHPSSPNMAAQLTLSSLRVAAIVSLEGNHATTLGEDNQWPHGHPLFSLEGCCGHPMSSLWMVVWPPQEKIGGDDHCFSWGDRATTSVFSWGDRTAANYFLLGPPLSSLGVVAQQPLSSLGVVVQPLIVSPGSGHTTTHYFLCDHPSHPLSSRGVAVCRYVWPRDVFPVWVVSPMVVPLMSYAELRRWFLWVQSYRGVELMHFFQSRRF
jgi:hypothetical protein